MFDDPRAQQWHVSGYELDVFDRGSTRRAEITTRLSDLLSMQVLGVLSAGALAELTRGSLSDETGHQVAGPPLEWALERAREMVSCVWIERREFWLLESWESYDAVVAENDGLGEDIPY